MSELHGKRIITYLRVSTEEQARNGESIADQRQALRKWADQTSERIKFTFQQKRARGEIVSGNMPKGYLLQDGKPVKDPATAPGVAAFWAEYLSSGRLSAAMDKARDAGLPMAVSTGSFMLRNAAHYAGQIQGCPCEPYITPADRDRIASTRKPTPRRSGQTYLFSGMIFCAECNGRMGAHRNLYKRKTGMDGVQVYYNCTTHYCTRPAKCSAKVNIYERDVEKHLLAHLEDVLEDYAVAAELQARAADAIDHNATARKIEQLERKKARCLDAYLDGFLEKEAFKQRQESIDAQLNELRRTTTMLPRKSPEEIRTILSDQWRATYDGLDLAGRRRFWYSILDRVTISSDRAIHFTLSL